MSVRTESPIEMDFLAALQAIGGDRVKFMPNATERQLRGAAMDDEMGYFVFVSSQVPIRARGKSYRADFLMAAHFSAAAPRVLCVECDGKAFHDAERDQARDVALIHAGIQTLRFSGARLRKDSFLCAREALEEFGPMRKDAMSFVDALAGALTSAATQYGRHAYGEDVPREDFREAQA